MIEFMTNFGHTFLSIFIDFGLHLGLHFSSKIAPKATTLLGGPPLFLNFCFYRLSGVPHAPDFSDFGPSSGHFFLENIVFFCTLVYVRRFWDRLVGTREANRIRCLGSVVVAR